MLAGYPSSLSLFVICTTSPALKFSAISGQDSLIYMAGTMTHDCCETEYLCKVLSFPLTDESIQ